MRGAAAAFAFHGGTSAPVVSRRGTPAVAPPPPPNPPSGTYLTGKASFGAYNDILQLDGWLGRRLACKSFYVIGHAPGYSSIPTSTSHDPYWQTRTYFMVNEPVPGGFNTATDRNRARANGSQDSYIRACAEACASVIANNANYRYVVWAANEFQSWWNTSDGGLDLPAWQGAMRRCYTIGKEVLGSSLIFALCPTHNWPPNLAASGTRNCPVRWTDWYIGDNFCDAVGMTLYSTWRPTATGFNLYGNTWKDQLLDPRNDWGPEGMFNFAVQRGKWFFISEYGPMWDASQWGYTPPSWYDAEQADFFQFSFDRWLSKPQCVGTIFFNDWSHDGYHKIDNLPQARAKLTQLWS